MVISENRKAYRVGITNIFLTMKKISLSTVKNSMRRDELRAIKGGSACRSTCSAPFCSMYGYKAECGTQPVVCCS